MRRRPPPSFGGGRLLGLLTPNSVNVSDKRHGCGGRRWEGPWEGGAEEPRKMSSKVCKADLAGSRLTEEKNNDLQMGAEAGT